MMNTILSVGAIIYGVFALLLFVRFVKGPSAADRCVAADGIDLMTCVILIFYSIVTGRSIYLDIAIVAALLGFIGTMFTARYLERKL